MPPAVPPQLDIVTVSIALATWLFGPASAEIIGPYAVILVGAVGGASWSAAKRPPATRLGTLLYMAWMVGLALIATVPIAELVARWFEVSARWIVAPVAVVVAARPDWVIGHIRKLIDGRAEEQRR